MIANKHWTVIHAPIIRLCRHGEYVVREKGCGRLLPVRNSYGFVDPGYLNAQKKGTDVMEFKGMLAMVLVVGGLLAFVAAPASAGILFVDPMFGVDITTDIQYGTNVNGFGGDVALYLDLYRPTGPGLPSQSPAIVMMHGGYYETGDKVHEARMATEFAKRGYVAVSINYRMIGDLPPRPGAPLVPDPDRVPDWVSRRLDSWGITFEQYMDTIAAATEDQATAVQWLVDNAATYDIDPGMIAAGGYSAGAVSSLLLGAGAVDGVSADIGAVFSRAGAIFGLETALDPNDPGVFILHGTLDTTIPYTEVAYLKDGFAANGIPFESLEIEGVGHHISNDYVLVQNPELFFGFMIDQLAPVPEPSTLAIWSIIGGLGLVASQYRRRRAA
jgi:predicted esterase